jgi:hypothetical protein
VEYLSEYSKVGQIKMQGLKAVFTNHVRKFQLPNVSFNHISVT